MSIALRYTSNQHDAEEILNDSFLKVFKNLSSFNLDLSFKAWLSRIVTNTSIDFLRKKKKAAHFVEITDENTCALEMEDTEEINLESELALLPIVQQLSPQYRMVFNLYVFEDYSHAEIAEKLNISVGTSKSNYSRAKKIVKEALFGLSDYAHLQKSVV